MSDLKHLDPEKQKPARRGAQKRIPIVVEMTHALLVGQKIVRLLQALSPKSRSVALQVVREHFAVEATEATETTEAAK
jgi:hypothetical protein